MNAQRPDHSGTPGQPEREDPRWEDPAGRLDEDTRDFGGFAGAGDPTAARMARLAAERDEALALRQRALADFANFQRRANESEIRAFQNGGARVIRSLLGPLDHFDLALAAGTKAGAPAQLLDGVRMVRDEIAKALEEHGVRAIVPARGDEFDPMRHEAMLRQSAPDLPPNSVTQALAPGYSMGEVVLRPAKVAVSAAEG